MQIENGDKVTRLLNATVAGTGDTLSSTILDMAGFEGVEFVAALGTVTSGAVLTLQAQGNTANSTSGMATVTGTTAVTDVGGANSNTLMLLGYYQPQKRFLRAQLVRATANAAVDGIFAIQYKARTQPVTNGATVSSTQSLVGV